MHIFIVAVGNLPVKHEVRKVLSAVVDTFRAIGIESFCPEDGVSYLLT